jgi:hypothetical protein
MCQNSIDMKTMMRLGRRTRFIVLFTKPTYFLAGGGVAGLGVSAMHFMGLYSTEAEATVVPLIVALATLLGMVVASAGFWIVFRVLQWRPKREDYRVAASFIITGAVCSMHYSGRYGIELGEPEFDDSTACVPAILVATSAINGGLLVVVLSTYFLLLVVRYETALARSRELQEIADLVRSELFKAESIGDAKIRVDRNVLKIFCTSTSASGMSPSNSHTQGSPKTSQVVPAPGSPRTSQGRSSPHPSSHEHSHNSGSRHSGHKHVSLVIGDRAALEEAERRVNMSHDGGDGADFSLVSESAAREAAGHHVHLPRDAKPDSEHRELSPVPDSPFAPSVGSPQLK